MKKTMWIPALAASGLAAALLFGATATAGTVITCGIYTTEDATANGAFADDCAWLQPDTNQAGRDQLVTNSFGTDWEYIGKFDSEAGAQEQGDTFSLAVTGFEDGLFSYTLSLVDPEPGTITTIEWVLGVKQANSFVAYFWESVTLNVEGTFVSTFNPGVGDTNAYSHIAGYVRNKTTEVPEPASLALLGGGLLALGWAMRRRSRSDFAG